MLPGGELTVVVTACLRSIVAGVVSDLFFKSRRPPVIVIFMILQLAAIIMIVLAGDIIAASVAFSVYSFACIGVA